MMVSNSIYISNLKLQSNYYKKKYDSKSLLGSLTKKNLYPYLVDAGYVECMNHAEVLLGLRGLEE